MNKKNANIICSHFIFREIASNSIQKVFHVFFVSFLDKFIYGKILINIEKINKIGILKNENKKVMIITHTLKIESIRVMQTIFIFRRK